MAPEQARGKGVHRRRRRLRAWGRAVRGPGRRQPRARRQPRRDRKARRHALPALQRLRRDLPSDLCHAIDEAVAVQRPGGAGWVRCGARSRRPSTTRQTSSARSREERSCQLREHEHVNQQCCPEYGAVPAMQMRPRTGPVQPGCSCATHRLTRVGSVGCTVAWLLTTCALAKTRRTCYPASAGNHLSERPYGRPISSSSACRTRRRHRQATCTRRSRKPSMLRT